VGDHAFDVAVLAQPANAPVGSGRRHAHRLGQGEIGQPRIGLQGVEQSEVEWIEHGMNIQMCFA
jgi:hypothetical protein